MLGRAKRGGGIKNCSQHVLSERIINKKIKYSFLLSIVYFFLSLNDTPLYISEYIVCVSNFNIKDVFIKMLWKIYN